MTPELTRDQQASLTPVPAGPDDTGRSPVHRLLDSIDELVRRHRALAAHDGTDDVLHAELIAAELDQQVAVLRRLPRPSHT